MLMRWLRLVLVCALMVVPVLWGATARAAGNKPTPTEAKVSTYIEIINSESEHVFSNYDRYTKRLKDVEKGPTCTELGPQSWISGMGPSAPERYAGFRKGIAKKPKLDMDETVTSMLDAVEALYKPENEASEYYFQSKFKQDNCMKWTPSVRPKARWLKLGACSIWRSSKNTS